MHAISRASRHLCEFASPLARKLCTASCLLLLLCCFALQAPAQTLTGAIQGTALDSTGAAIPGATVTVSSPALITGKRVMAADAEGFYKFLELSPGTYTLRVESPGYSVYVTTNIAVNSAVTVTADSKLAPGSVSQEVVVNGSAVSIDTENVASQAVLGQQLLEGIPAGRSPWAEANLVPSVMPSGRDVGGSTGMQAATMVVHGSTVADQRFMIDGVNVNWPGSGGGSTAIYYDQGMFQEINYRIGALPAEIGQSGVYMNMVTKDGGNQIHGTIFANGAGKGMQSDNIGNGSLRALLLKNVTASQQSNPNLELGNPITINYDYNGQLGGPLLKDKLWWFGSFRWWKVNNLVSGAFNPDATSAINDNLIANEMVKFSYQLNPKNKISIMYSRNQKNRYHRRNSPPYFISDKASYLQNQPGSTSIAKWIYMPTPKWVIDSGVGFMHLKYPQRYQKDVVATDISITDSALSTLINAAPYSYVNPTWRLALDTSASTVINRGFGTHSIKIGAEFSHDYYAQIYKANGDLQGVMINGKASTVTLYNTPINQQTNNLDMLAFYGQDNWKIANRLTFDLGLRWEYLHGYIPAQHADQGTFFTSYNKSPAAVENVPNWKDFTPRLGASWDITGRGTTVVKASLSKYVQGVAMNVVAAVNPLGFSTASVVWTDKNGDGTPQFYATGDSRNEFDPTTSNGLTGGATTRLDPAVRRPNSWEQSLGVDQRLPYGIVLSVSGWHRSTSDQIGRINDAVPTSAYTPITTTNPAGGTFTIYNQSLATKGQVNYRLANSPLLNFEYRGIDVNVAKSMSNHWLVNGGVTFSRLRGATTGDVGTSLDDLNNPNNNINRTSVLSYDTPVQLKLASVYQLPKGFEVSGNFQHATGFPYAMSYSYTTAILGTTLNQTTQSVVVAPAGANRLPDFNLLDMRLANNIKWHDRYTFKPEFDVYNLNNSAAVQSVNQSYNSAALARNPTAVLPPRLFKVGIQFLF
jgi:outer membrane receptor protein involved in Fe transport